MLKITCAPVALVAVIALSGCNGQNNMFRSPSSSLHPAVGTAATAAPAAAPVSSGPAVPYVLRAESAGPYIDFSIYNMSNTEMVVDKEHFALLSPGDREVIPYNKQSTVIDLPQPAVVPPNGTIAGRAVFREVNSPVGKRLVYKPDATGTFADINRTAGPGQTAAAPAQGPAAAAL